MDEKRKSDQAIPLLGLAAIIASSLGYYLWLEPLKTFRPSIEDPPKPPLERNLPARLWQDPIGEARKSYANRSASEPPQGETGPIQLGESDHLLVVQLYGGYSQLDYETRLRTRYAVGLALERSGFEPDGSDTEFLRFRTLDLELDAENKDRKTAKVVPYERWKPSISRGDDCQTETLPHVFVLWVGDDISTGEPFQTLDDVVGRVTGRVETKRPLRIIGPTSSGGLRAMVSEVNDPKNEAKNFGEKFLVYSPWATADDAFLYLPPVRSLPDLIQRTIANDRVVAGHMLAELRARHVDLGVRGADEIALLSEWDTAYGRSLPVTFAACMLISDEQNLPCEKLANADQIDIFRRATRRVLQVPEAWPVSLKRVIYLRGLDGIGPRAGPLDSKSSEKSRGGSLAAELERPDGSSQLDYARRLADEIARPGGRRLRAVGVLGSDIYDKLLMLQALGERLPGVIFFTTDLDASYLHSTQLEWTRNLLVGSSFPLKMTEAAAGAKLSPPFRDVYGTAIFQATLRAVKDLSCRAQSSIEELESRPPSVAVYEIGRTDAHRLEYDRRSILQRLQPVARFGIWMLLLAVVLPSLHILMTGELAWRTFVAAMSTVLFFLVLYLGFGAAEPLYWIEGVSIWPSELCRLIAAVLAVLLLRRARHGLSRNRQLVCQDFQYSCQPDWPRTFSRPWWARFWQLLVVRWTEPRPVGALWAIYDEYDRPGYRYLRASALTAFTTVVVWVARVRENAPRPCRADSCTADTMVSFLSLLAQFLLLFIVVDVTLACCRWIVAMRETRSRQEVASIQGYPEAWLEIELMARRTMEVSKLVLYPFLTLPFLILSQFSFFDRWSWPVSVLVVYGGLLILALAAALILRRCAESARGRACEEVRALRVKAIDTGMQDAARRMESALREIQDESRGAFSPLSQNPVLAAILLPISGAGTGLALDSLLKSF